MRFAHNVGQISVVVFMAMSWNDTINVGELFSDRIQQHLEAGKAAHPAGVYESCAPADDQIAPRRPEVPISVSVSAGHAHPENVRSFSRLIADDHVFAVILAADYDVGPLVNSSLQDVE